MKNPAKYMRKLGGPSLRSWQGGERMKRLARSGYEEPPAKKKENSGTPIALPKVRGKKQRIPRKSPEVSKRTKANYVLKVGKNRKEKRGSARRQPHWEEQWNG